MNARYIIRRLTFASELKGFFPRVKYFIQELISLTTRIRPKGIQKVIWKGPKGNLILNYYDSLVAWRAEILDDKIYDIELKKSNPIILDLGSNQGFSILWFKYNYPDARIFAYEPLKKSFEVLETNILDNQFSNTHCFNFGVLDKNCKIDFYHRKGGAGLGDSIVPDYTSSIEKCSFGNIDNIFDRIDLVKVDVEGSEFNILENMNFWKIADQLIIEFHDGYKEPLGFKDIDFIKLVEDAGFILTKRTPGAPTYICYFQKH